MPSSGPDDFSTRDIPKGYEVRHDVDLPDGRLALWAVTGSRKPLTEDEKASQADWEAATFTPLEQLDAQLAEKVAGALVDEFLRCGGLSAHRKAEALDSLRLRRGITPRGTLILAADLPLGEGHPEHGWDGSPGEALKIAVDIGQTAGQNISAERAIGGPIGWEPEYDGTSP